MMKQIKDVVELNIQYDRDLHIATANSRQSSKWKNNQLKLSEFLKRLAQHTKSRETHDEYMALPKAKQDDLKDVGGFVGGLLKGGRRNANSVANRDVVTLDADFAPMDFLERVKGLLNGVNYAIYSTRKHTRSTPRYRVLVFTDRSMLADEYQAVSRKLAFKLGIDYFDDSTYEPHRLMYWGSACSDVDYEFYHNDAPFVEVDFILGEYSDWQDTTQWHQSSRKNETFSKGLNKLGDPKEKKGIVGAFCRVFSISETIVEFLNDVYKKESENRYTFIGGSSSKGLVVYDNIHAFSNHSTDPAFGLTLNAFDLVRVHKFGDLDENSKFDTPINKLPSTNAMREFALEIQSVKTEMLKSGISYDDEHIAELFDEVNDNQESDVDWLHKLETNDKGDILTTFLNATTICSNDPKIKNVMVFNELSLRVERGRTGEMWQATDSYAIRKYIGKNYRCDFPEAKIEQAIEDAASFNAYHPIKEYLKGIEWDGMQRVETLFIDWFGADDNVYTRDVARVFLNACITRVFQPGYKFDTVPVLGGHQGLGKSTFISLLAKEKYFVELDTYDKQKAVETTTGKWIVELVEMAASNKHELEEQKAFITSTAAMVRLAYARHPREFKRQFCLVGTTNEKEYLKDSTGNRRFLPIDCKKELDQEAFAKIVNQLWAEAYCDYELFGADVLLSGAAAKIAKSLQEEKRVSDDWKGVIEEWITQPAILGRYSKDYDPVMGGNGETEERDRICVREIWEDCLKQRNEPRPFDSKRIATILDNINNLERNNSIRFGERFGRQKGWKIPTKTEEEIPF